MTLGREDSAAEASAGPRRTSRRKERRAFIKKIGLRASGIDGARHPARRIVDSCTEQAMTVAPNQSFTPRMNGQNAQQKAARPDRSNHLLNGFNRTVMEIAFAPPAAAE